MIEEPEQGSAGEQERIGPGHPPVHSRWKKGQSGNPGGRPKSESLTARLRRVLEQEHNGRVLLDLLAERMAKEALAGKFPFVKEVADRLDGRPGEKHQITLERPSLREIIAGLTDEDLLDLAVRTGRVAELPVYLREIARERGLYTPPPEQEHGL